MNDEVRHFSLRKLSIGLASVLVGVSIFGTSQTVKADTVANNQTSSVTNNAQSSDTQENKNAVKSSFSNDNQVNNAKSNLIQTQVEGKNEQKQVQTENVQQDSAPKTQEATDSNELQEKSAEKNIVSTSSLQGPDNQSNTVTEKTVQHDALEGDQKAQSFNLPKNSQKLAKKALATNLIETPSSPMTNGGFDEATWGKLDVNNWHGSVQDGVYQLTGYTGDPNHIIVPNEADFEKAGRSTNGLQVGITRDAARLLLSNQKQTIAFSKTNNQKVKAIGTDWSWAFSADHKYLSKFDGSNLDVSGVTNMSNMFSGNKISDLKSLANWDTSKVTDMSAMFDGNKISDLKPLANWNTSKVTSMYMMFYGNQISNLTPLTNWNTSNVTDMSNMFVFNSISNLTPLANWKTGNVTSMNGMFKLNSISNLTPLANWDTSKVTDMSNMFSDNQISDLTPLTNWKISNVTGMYSMFANNSDIIDLGPIANWNISSVKNDGSLFAGDYKLDLNNIKNDASLMQGFLKTPKALYGATFITNNADLVKATINKDWPTLTNTAKRTITFNIPHAAPEPIVQTINYKAVAPAVQVQFDYYRSEIVKTYPVKASDWQLDDSKQNDAIIVNGQIHFKPVKIPHVNGYKAYIVPNKSNPALFTVSFMAVPTENKPSTPVEETPSKPSAPTAPTENKPSTPAEATPSKPSAPTDNSSNSAWTDLKHKVVNTLNQSDSGWTMPADNSTYKAEVPVNDATIDLSDLVIAQPVHARTRTQIHVTKRFKLRKHGKKHAVKHLKHRKRVSKLFSKRYALL